MINSLTKDHKIKPIKNLDQATQYKERKQVSILKGSKAELLKQYYGNIEMLE